MCSNQSLTIVPQQAPAAEPGATKQYGAENAANPAAAARASPLTIVPKQAPAAAPYQHHSYL
jgi:hypothetical protein